MVFCVCGYMGKQGGQITDQGHMVGTAAADHILPDDHAQPVTVIIPAQGLQLDVLTQHIKAHFLCQPDIPDKGLVAGGGHQAVGPVALIQKAMKKIGSVIQTEPGDPFFVGLYGEGAQCKVALYGVLVCCQSKGVQVRLLRRLSPGRATMKAPGRPGSASMEIPSRGIFGELPFGKASSRQTGSNIIQETWEKALSDFNSNITIPLSISGVIFRVFT